MCLSEKKNFVRSDKCLIVSDRYFCLRFMCMKWKWKVHCKQSMWMCILYLLEYGWVIRMLSVFTVCVFILIIDQKVANSIQCLWKAKDNSNWKVFGYCLRNCESRCLSSLCLGRLLPEDLFLGSTCVVSLNWT